MSTTFSMAMLLTHKVSSVKTLDAANNAVAQQTLNKQIALDGDDINQSYLLSSVLLGLSSISIDLAGALTNWAKEPMILSSVKSIYFANLGGSSVFQIGKGLTPFCSFLGTSNDSIVIKPGMILSLFSDTDIAGYVVSGGAHDVLKIKETAGKAGSFNLLITGRKA